MWLVAKPTEEMPATAIVVKADSSIIVSASKLGNLKNTFLMINNLNDVNEAVYQ